MSQNIFVGAVPDVTIQNKLRYLIPLSFEDGVQQVEINVSISVNNFIIFLNLNSLDNSNLFISSYTLNKETIYFAGFKCVFGNYINLVDNNCPYLLYFLDKSNGQNYQRNSSNITFESINNGVSLYAELR